MVVLGCCFFELDKERVIYIRNSRRFLPKQMLNSDFARSLKIEYMFDIRVVKC